MRRFYSIILTLIFYFFLTLPVSAEWTKYPQNPVLPTAQNTWYSQHTASPTVLYEDGVFKMWFQGHTGSTWKIGYAQSNDGIHWDVSSQPQITASGDGLGVVEPSVIKNGLIYQMWYHEYTQNESRIRYATSTNAISWNIYPQPVLTKLSGGWENSGPTNPGVIFENNEYKMWYVAAGNGSSWKVGYATSSDGTTWVRYQNNPLTIPTLGFIGGPTVLKLNETYHMWYHTGSGQNTDIYHVVSTDGISWSCDGNCSVLHMGDSFDSQGITAPSILKQDSKLYMWYGGSNGSRWQINLATFDLPQEPTPTPSPTATPTPTSTPIPTPTLQKTPVVIIPGLMASWNKNAILHNLTVPQSEWKLAPFVKEYEGIIDTFKKLNYKENTDLFVFVYDWRKSVENIADDFQIFLQEKLWNQKPDSLVNIISHSLGGLVGRIWQQKYNSQNLKNLITVGTPHRGTSQVYRAVEAGEIDKSNSLLWLGEKLILTLNKNSFETDKETINQMLPVLKDLFPTYQFLKKPDENFIPIDSMQIKNSSLLTYNAIEQATYPLLHTIAGDKTSNTAFGFTITERTPLDQLLNFYVDGRPQETLYDNGDYIILSASAGIGNSIKTLSKDHGELIYQKDAIKEILDTLKIPYEDSQVIEGQGSKITPSLIFLMKSPAEMTVSDMNGNQFSGQDGILFIENPQEGSYSLQVKGIDQGKYNVVVGEIGTANDSWNTISGEINTIPPSSQTDQYQIQFEPNAPQEFFVDQTNIGVLFTRVISLVKELNSPASDQLTQVLKNLEAARSYFQNNKFLQSRNRFLSAHHHLFNARKILFVHQNNKVLEIASEFENLYQKSLTNYEYKQTAINKLKRQLDQYGKKIATVQTLLVKKKTQGKSVIHQAFILDTIVNKKNKAQENFANKNYAYTEILLESNNLLFKETVVKN